MLRHPRPLPRALMVGWLAAALCGCGIKGPLTSPPAPGAAKAPTETAKPAPHDASAPPKL